MNRYLSLNLVLPIALTSAVNAAIIAQDDFSSATSGTGWAAGDSWDGLVDGGVRVGTGNPQDTFRAFSTAFTASTNDKLYIAVDFTQAGTGAQWGGLSLFEGAAGGAERFFLGDPGAAGAVNYGIDGYVGPSVDSGVPITAGATVRLIAELDFNVNPENQSTYRLWVNNFDINAPNGSETGGTPLGMVGSIRLASDGNFGPVTYDNLIVATTAAEVGLVPEPGAVLLLGLAGTLFGLRRKRA